MASGIADGAKRSLQTSSSLQNAQAHQALRASLLCEKQELISNLQDELGQVGQHAHPHAPFCSVVSFLGSNSAAYLTSAL